MTLTHKSASLFLIFVIGCPGAGKGTLCRKLATEYHGSHLSVGDLLRAKTSQAANDTEPEDEKKGNLNEHGALAQHIRNGTLVPTELLLSILGDMLDEYTRDEKPGFVLVDGFPRVLTQGLEAEKVVGAPDLVLFFDCGEEIAAERFLTRKLPGRLTDDRAMFEKRYTEFGKLNGEIVEHYRALGKLVEVDSKGETEASYGRLIQALSARGEWSELMTGLGASEI